MYWLLFPSKNNNSGNGNESANQFFPFKGSFFYAVRAFPEAQFHRKPGFEVITMKQGSLCRTEPVHTPDNGKRNKRAHQTAGQHVPGANLKEDGGRASIRKKPEQNAGNQSSKLYPSGRYPHTGLAWGFCLKIPCKLIRAPDTSAMTIPHIKNLRLLKYLSGTEYPKWRKVIQHRYWIFNPVIVKQKKM